MVSQPPIPKCTRISDHIPSWRSLNTAAANSWVVSLRQPGGEGVVRQFVGELGETRAAGGQSLLRHSLEYLRIYLLSN